MFRFPCYAKQDNLEYLTILHQCHDTMGCSFSKIIMFLKFILGEQAQSKPDPCIPISFSI